MTITRELLLSAINAYRTGDERKCLSFFRHAMLSDDVDSVVESLQASPVSESNVPHPGSPQSSTPDVARMTLDITSDEDRELIVSTLRGYLDRIKYFQIFDTVAYMDSDPDTLHEIEAALNDVTSNPAPPPVQPAQPAAPVMEINEEKEVPEMLVRLPQEQALPLQKNVIAPNFERLHSFSVTTDGLLMSADVETLKSLASGFESWLASKNEDSFEEEPEAEKEEQDLDASGQDSESSEELQEEDLGGEEIVISVEADDDIGGEEIAV